MKSPKTLAKQLIGETTAYYFSVSANSSKIISLQKVGFPCMEIKIFVKISQVMTCRKVLQLYFSYTTVFIEKRLENDKITRTPRKQLIQTSDSSAVRMLLS